MADTLQFKKGLLAGLNSASKKAGTIYITTDERAMYVDIDDSTRIRLGDFIEVATQADLSKYAPYSTTALYFITATNALLKYKGMVGDEAQFVTINSTAAVQSQIDQVKATAQANQNAIKAINTTIGTAAEGDEPATGLIKDIADNEAAIAALTQTVGNNKTAAEQAIAKVREDFAAADSTLSGKITANENAIKTKADSSTVTNLATELRGKDEAIEENIDEVEGRLDALEATVNNSTTGLSAKVTVLEGAVSSINNQITTINTNHNTLKGRVDTAEGEIDDLESRMGTAEGDIDSLEGRMTTAEGKISSLEGKMTTAEGKITANENAIKNINTELAKKADKTALAQVEEDYKAADEALDGRVTSLETKVGKAAEGNNAATGLFKDVADLKAADTTLNGKITANENAIKTKASQADLEALSKTVSDNKSAIEGTVNTLTGRVDTAENDIDDLQTRMGNMETRAGTIENSVTTLGQTVASTYVKISDYNTKVKALEDKDDEQDGRLSDLEAAVGESTGNLQGQVTTLAAQVNTNKGNIEALQAAAPQITTNKNDIAAINTAIGTKSDTADTTIYGYINSSFAAADAMKFMGSVTAYNALLSKSDVEAGHTYVLTATDSTSTSGKTYAVGDLFIALKDGDNTQWTHVPSGYVQGLESLSGANNKLVMKNHTGATVGSITVEAVADTAITATVANNKLTIGMEWGSF